MGTISITVPSDGQSIDASDVATPLNTIVSEINGSLDSNNIASGGVVPNNLTSGTGTSWAWQSWTPTYTNFTLGNGTLDYAKYIQIGKTVFGRVKITVGSTTAFSGSLAMIVSSPTSINSELFGQATNIGSAYLRDAGTATYHGTVQTTGSDNQMALICHGASGSFLTANPVINTQPHTWANTDIIAFTFAYEAA